MEGEEGDVMWFVLIILFGGGVDGGRAIDTNLKFHSEETCETAARKIAVARVEGRGDLYSARAVCVAVPK
jgi:hypothetical protein